MYARCLDWSGSLVLVHVFDSVSIGRAGAAAIAPQPADLLSRQQMALLTAANAELVALPLLADAASYSSCTFDYTSNASRDPDKPVTVNSWIEVFRKSTPTFKAHCLTDASVPEAERPARAQQFADAFSSVLDALDAQPQVAVDGYGVPPINCVSLCRVREQCLRAAGFSDVFLEVKARENAAALKLLPQVLAQLDTAGSPRGRLEAALRGVFAGNIFDLGAAATAAAYQDAGGVDFTAVLQKLLPRPWVVDDLDAILDRLEPNPQQQQQQQAPVYRKALFFVDNSGADVVLGMLPLARELLQRGTSVVLAANRVPSINDITAAELQPLLQAAGEADAVLRRGVLEGSLRVVESGNDLPVIDLSRVSPAAAAVAQECDLLVLEGMGRAIETNLLTQFTCDAWMLGMVKHPEVASCLGGRMYDCVCKYTPGSGARSS